jgi:starch synthase
MARAQRLKLLSVASEVFPLVKTGGLADVAGALPGALKAERIDVRTLVPGYPAVMRAIDKRQRAGRFDALMGGHATVWRARIGTLDLLVLDAPHLYDRPGNPYLGPDGRDWPDNAERFAALAHVAAEIGRGRLPEYVPDIIHVHDWQAALVPAFFRYGDPGPPVVLTIHNLAFQGRFPPDALRRIGLPDAAYALDGVEYFGDIGFLKAGILFADAITTVSPSYAAEIQTPAGGMALDGLLRARADDLVGILNGVDTQVWDPGSDPEIARPYRADSLGTRGANSAALRKDFGLDADPPATLFGAVSRLTAQKGFDLLLAALPRLVAAGGQLALLGSGEPAIEAELRAAVARYPGRVACVFGYDERVAHQIQAGADAFLVPSRFEPCGLTQLYALRYGAVPVVARVGGLADTVIDANPFALERGVATGIQFAPDSVPALEAAISHAIALHRDPPAWRRIQANGMACDVSWTDPAHQYARLFRKLAAG